MSEPPAGFAGFVSASHEILFEDTSDRRCDVCAAEIEDETDEGYGVSGRGLLVWARGDERRYQEPPLCQACAAAVGMTALSRWEIEEDEG